MKLIKSVPRYRCDFCKKTGTKFSIEIHEKRCFRNPNRYCDCCENTGEVVVETLECGEYERDIMGACPYCASFDKNKLKQIEERERLEKESIENPPEADIEEMQF